MEEEAEAEEVAEAVVAGEDRRWLVTTLNSIACVYLLLMIHLDGKYRNSGRLLLLTLAEIYRGMDYAIDAPFPLWIQWASLDGQASLLYPKQHQKLPP